MTLQRCTDLSAADWIIGSETPWWQLVTFGPDAFEASARLRLIPDPTAPGQHEGDVEDEPVHLASEGEWGARALRVLTRWTATPERVYFAVWLGDGNTDDIPPGPTFDLPERPECALLAGDGSDLEEGRSVLSERRRRPPAMVWPADRAWVMACDVDPHWAGIGAPRDAVGELMAAPDIDVVPADPRARQPEYDGPSLDATVRPPLPPGFRPGVYRHPGVYRP
ncbi:hypothetical protein GCM10023216_08590 [Isoptericola chiayiensis]|uniref:Uncharacterized protein n=1 Tax=Isoptericola chiayiensis TaxID=579446 RepID=A0ABP8Y6P0_9MICO|nr:hypothetical protein [Isoptericola chiayiensis]NOV99182.1 hypothetical protein [Isoptericola chiayiensis]